MKHTALAALLLLAAALGALELDMTLMGEMPYIESSYFQLADIDGDNTLDWLISEFTYGDGEDELHVMRYNLACQLVWDGTIQLPRDVPAQERSEPCFSVAAFEDERLLLVGYGDSYWNDDCCSVWLRSYSIPSLEPICASMVELFIGGSIANHTSYTAESLNTLYTSSRVLCMQEIEKFQCFIYDSNYTQSYWGRRMIEWQITPNSNSCIRYLSTSGVSLRQPMAVSDTLYLLHNRRRSLIFPTWFEEGLSRKIYYRDLDNYDEELLHEMDSYYDIVYQDDDILVYYTHYMIQTAEIKQPKPSGSQDSPLLGLLYNVKSTDIYNPDVIEYCAELLTLSRSGVPQMVTNDILFPDFSAAFFIDYPEPNRYIMAVNDTTLALIDMQTGLVREPMHTGDLRIFDMFYTDGDYYAIAHNTATNMYQIYRIDNITLDADDEAAPAPQATLTAYPNPFNPETTMRFEMAQPGPARLEVYNIRGQRVATLLDEPLPAGEKEVTWNANCMSSGVYLVRLHTEGGDQTTKLVLLK